MYLASCEMYPFCFSAQLAFNNSHNANVLNRKDENYDEKNFQTQLFNCANSRYWFLLWL